MRVLRARPDLVALAATLAVAAVARLSWLDLMEFKGDEANACRLALHVLGYSEPGIGRFFPTAGLVSSVGVPNPPLFVYLVAIPLAIVRSPIAVAAAIATANVFAIWLTYVAGKRCFDRFVGLASAAMLAVSPWGIVFSRKIWAQDLLPVCTTLFVLQLHALLVERRPRASFWLIVIAAAAVQLHFSAGVLVVVLTIALILARRGLQWRWVAYGAVVAALLYAPYLALHAGGMLHTAQHHARYAGPGRAARLLSAARYTVGIVAGGSMRYLIGRSSTLATVLSAVLGVLGPLGLVAAARGQSGARTRLSILFCVWYALPLVLLTVLDVRPYMHYFIVLLPLPYFGVAYLGERLLARRPALAVGVLGLTLACFVLIDASVFRTIIHNGGAPGDYGIAYRNTQRAVRFVLHEAAGRPFLIGEDVNFAPVRPLRTYRFLLWNASPNRPPPQGRPSEGFVFVDGFRGTPPLLRHDPRARSFARTSFGPLTVVQVPMR